MTGPFRVEVAGPFDPTDIFLAGPDGKAYPLVPAEAVGLADALLAAAHAPRPTARTVPCFVCGAPVPAHLPKCPGPCSPRSVVS